MRAWFLAAMVIFGGSALPGTARAAAPKGWEFGFRTGYAVPAGNFAGGSAASVGDVMKGVVPAWFDIGYRFDPHFMVGLFFEFGYGLVDTSPGKPLDRAGCNGSGVSCDAYEIAFGPEVAYHWLPDQAIDPWVAAGVGYEVADFVVNVNDQTATSNFNGPQLFHLQAGFDWKMQRLGIGPFVAFSLNQFLNCSVSSTNGVPCSVQQTSMHEWVTVGIRLEVDYGG